MTSTVFVDKETLIKADWLNDVNMKTYADTADTVRYMPAGVGAVATTVQAELRASYRVDNYTSVQAAFDTIPDGGTLVFTPGMTYEITALEVSGKSAVLLGYGATLNSANANGAIYKTDHGNKLTVIGLSFTGIGAGIKQDATVQTSSQDELDIVGCSFDMDSGVYGVYIDGGRNPRIQNCFFRNTNSGSGVYFKDTVSPFLSTCTFKGGGYTGRGVYYPGTGNGTDAGLIIRDCEIMGWDKGVEVVGCDWLVIEGSTIDYNNQSIKLGSQDRANISNNYIGSLGATAALWITYDAAGTAPNYSEKIIVVNNTFTGHYEGGNTYDCILVDGANSPQSVVISNNSISFYTRYGINFSLVSTKMLVTGNTFAQRSGFGVAPIYNTLGALDSGVVIENNLFNNVTTISAMNLSLSHVEENINCRTKNQGQAFLGAGGSTFTIAHGLSYTPASKDVLFSAMNLETAQKTPYLVGVDATNITINLTAAAVGTCSLSWRVNRSH